jgi:hypothetical protein
MTLSPREWKIGPHTLRFEPPDLLRIDFRGTLTLEQAPHMVEIYRELGTALPLYALGDMRDADPLTPEVRHYLSEHIRHDWFLATIYFGARLVHKALIKGAVLAAQLTESANKEAVERAVERAMDTIYFTPTQEEAEQLLTQLRALRHNGKVA